MGHKTKIDWCDSTWNPVTGCLHGCEYCYARRIAERFGTLLKGFQPEDEGVTFTPDAPETFYELDEPVRDENGKIEPYPANFYPTLHRYRLDIPARWTKPKNIFVCSMADLFGEWVPDEWIKAVFDACKAGSRHRYLFLTKNPIRYLDVCPEHLPVNAGTGECPDMWFGSTWTGERAYTFHHLPQWCNRFVSIEPLLSPPEDCDLSAIISENDWVIIGAETGNRESKVVPHKRWINRIVDFCDIAKIPVFMKSSLLELMGDDFRQEFPWR